MRWYFSSALSPFWISISEISSIKERKIDIKESGVAYDKDKKNDQLSWVGIEKFSS